MKIDKLTRLSMLLLSIAGIAPAQAPVSGLSKYASGDGDKMQIAIPGGAGAAINGSSTGAAGPLIGFQVWKPDDYLLSTFFTFAPPQELAGTKRDFGSFLLTPPGRGTSFTFAGSKVRGIGKHIFVGGGGRAGITNTTWKDLSDSKVEPLSGSVAYFSPSLILTSETFRTPGNGSNEYQFGLLTGYGVRHLTGDLSQPSAAAFRQKLVNTDRTTLHGLEIEFFVRMNQFRPYFRYTRFQLNTEVPGLSGGQVVFGVDVLSSIFRTELSKPSGSK